jgi:hypothetical protein
MVVKITKWLRNYNKNGYKIYNYKLYSTEILIFSDLHNSFYLKLFNSQKVKREVR